MTDWPVLASLALAERNQLLRAGRRRRFAKGEVVFHHGDPADSLHLLDSGRVAAAAHSPGRAGDPHDPRTGPGVR